MINLLKERTKMLSDVDSNQDFKSGIGGIKRRIYLNEYNILMNNTAYLPLVCGLLRAYAETFAEISTNYEFAPFLFHIDSPEAILSNYNDPSVAAFSTSMWNEQLNLKIASEVKRRWPNCLIVFGGPQVPHKSDVYFKKFPFIDVTVRGDGEEAFADILIRFLREFDFSGIAGISWRNQNNGGFQYNSENRSFNKDLDIYPSPYLRGLYEDLMLRHNDMDFQSIIETNRGCPFQCTYCYWGKGGLNRKYRHHSLERVSKELEWCAQNKIRYVFSADSNFGMHNRDMEIAKNLVELKKKHGYPEKFRVNYGKNTDDKIYAIGVLLHECELEKGITLSRQTTNSQVLKNIKRENIKLETYSILQKKFNDKGVPVYTELILGLPGETYNTWIAGIEEMLRSGLSNQLFMYYLEVYPNTDLADPEYQRTFGIKTQRIVLNEIHCCIRKANWVKEYQDLVIQHNTMSVDDWRRMLVFSWVTMLLHSLKIGFFLMAYIVDRFNIGYTEFIKHISELMMPSSQGSVFREELSHFHEKIDNFFAGEGRGNIMANYGDIYWEVEEASFLRISERLDQFYQEFKEIIGDYLDTKGIPYDGNELEEAIRYQRMRIPSHCLPSINQWKFNFNFPEYFATRFHSMPVPLKREPQLLFIEPKDFEEDKKRYAREVIIWGRKSGLMLTKARWTPVP